MSIIADFAVPGGPTITMCSPAIADTVISRMISCLSRNCAPSWRAMSWNADEARATSTAKLRGVVGGATIWAAHITPWRSDARLPGRAILVALHGLARLAQHRREVAHSGPARVDDCLRSDRV